MTDAVDDVDDATGGGLLPEADPDEAVQDIGDALPEVDPESTVNGATGTLGLR